MAPNAKDTPPAVDKDRTQNDAAEENRSERDRTADDDTTMTDPTNAAGNRSPPGGTPGGDADKKRKRQFSNRTKTGCLTCRRRKKKCDEGKPECRSSHFRLPFIQLGTLHSSTGGGGGFLQNLLLKIDFFFFFFFAVLLLLQLLNK